MMEIIQTIWTALTTPNELATTILLFPMYFIDTLVNMLLFTTILDIKATKKSKIIYVFIMGLCAFISRTFITNPFSAFLNWIVGIILIKLSTNS